MVIRAGFEYWLKVRGVSTSSYLSSSVGCQRFLWNAVLELQLRRLKRGRRIVGMTASVKGSIEEPGVGVARKSRLNRSILDQSWGELARQLGYKLSWLGGLLLVVPPHFSSQECPDPDCGCIDAENRVSRDFFLCKKCGHTGPSDLVAARVIKGRGLRLRETLSSREPVGLAALAA
jgi:transposase